ncbi:MAG: hypothetical protein KJZ93_05655 [Caldilineaceae bacterium]|nr:hypothetical protein [Caldilineaceae bacterium]
MSQHSTHTLLISSDQELPSTLYGHFVRNGLAPLTIVAGVPAAFDMLSRVAPRLVLLDLQGIGLQHPTLPSTDTWEGRELTHLCNQIQLMRPDAKLVLVTASHISPTILAGYEGVAGIINRDTPLGAWPGRLLYLLGEGSPPANSAAGPRTAEGRGS